MIGPNGEERIEIEVLRNEAHNFEFEIPSNGLVELSFDTSAQAFDSLEIHVSVENGILLVFDLVV